MKKLAYSCIVLLLVFSLIFSFIACEEKDDNIETEKEEKVIIDPNSPDFNMLDVIHSIYDNSSIKPQTIESVHDLAILTSINASIDDEGPIGLASALLNGEAFTLITLGGTEDREDQATTMKESQLASFGQDNDYLTAVVKLFEDGTIPNDKPVFITGISLGGMIAQQILSKPTITDNFDIKYVVTFGSPFTLPTERLDTTIVRFTDTNDKVPKLGESFLFMVGVSSAILNPINEKERILRTSKYSKFIDVHALSYIEDECWDDLDFLGKPFGTNTLKTTTSLTYYEAPILAQ